MWLVLLILAKCTNVYVFTIRLFPPMSSPPLAPVSVDAALSLEEQPYVPLPFYFVQPVPSALPALVWQVAGRSFDPEYLASLGLEHVDMGFGTFICPISDDETDPLQTQ